MAKAPTKKMQVASLSAFSREELSFLLENLDKMPLSEQEFLLRALEGDAEADRVNECQENFMSFMKTVAPDHIFGAHHRKIATTLEEVVRGEKTRVIINIAPRHSKSETASYLFPSWFIGKMPDKQIIIASHTAELATGFGRRVRNLMDTPEYRDIFPDVHLSADSKAAGRWATSDGGVFFACGVGGALSGRGGDLILIDDPISEQQAKSGNTQAFLDQWEWFQQGLMTRLMPGGRIILLQTRWSKLDLTGQILNHMAKNPDAEQWELIELPAVLPSGEPLWPEFWSKEELEQKRISVGPAAWAAQYLQQPTSEGAQILKSEWWRNWDKDEPPECVYTVMSLDAAQEAHNRADYSAVTLWGVFYVDGADGRKMTNVILLNAWKDRLEFPDLKRAVLADYKKWKPDTFIVEKKSNGAALYQELRRMDIAVTEFTPSRGNDKIARVNSVSDMFASGMIWAPLDRRWAQEVVMECAEFPLGEHDDYVDVTSCALIRVRQGGFLTLPSDYEDNELPELRGRVRSYY